MNEELRALFPITKHTVYLNHAAVSPPPLPTVEAVARQMNDVVHNGSLNYRSWVAVKEKARTRIAHMLGAAKANQISFVRNTSDGLSTVANGLTWRAGDNIVTFRGEFPSNIYPWLRLQREQSGVEVRMCEDRDGRLCVDELINLIDEHTRIVAVSLVQYASGFRTDVERLGHAARKRDALLVVDVIQALGALPIDVENQLIDVAAGACHKWLLTPEGVGVLYLSDRARERLRPTLVGWMSVPDPGNYRDFTQGWTEGALAWETGTSATALIHGLEASLKLLMETGIEPIAAHLRDLTDHLCVGLGERGYEVVSSRRDGEKSQIVCMRHRTKRPNTLHQHLEQQGIAVALRGEGVRISPHLYNTSEDIERLLNSLP